MTKIPLRQLEKGKERFAELSFPDREYLEQLAKKQMDKALAKADVLKRLLMASGAELNWVADFITDASYFWTKEELTLDDLWLTGTGPDWNKVVIDECERSPVKFRQRLKNDPALIPLFKDAVFSDDPILLRYEEEKYKVLEGMNRVIAMLRDGKETVTAFVARPSGTPRPMCEPHVVYDLIRAYDRKLTTDRVGLIAALRLLRSCYANVDGLLRDRFTGGWMPNQEIREIVAEALKDGGA